MSNSAVTIYTGNRCAYCNAAKRLLDSKEVKYTEINVDDDPALREKMMTHTKRQSVPQIFIDDLHVGGFDDLAELNHDGKLDKLLSS
jgi:glutaredoxin 3